VTQGHPAEPRRPWAQASYYPDPAIRILDPSFQKYVIALGAVEQLATGFRWAEGPVWFGDGRYLLWSDIPNNRIMRWDEETGVTSVYRKPSDYANGNTRDRYGRLVTCEHGGRRVTRTEYDGRITVLADRFDGKRLNSPNDVVVKSDGSVWFTDPPFGLLSDYEGHKAEQELPHGLYRIDGESGRLDLLADDIPGPNGLAFSPDEKTLYVANSDPKRAVWMAFDVKPDGTLGAGRVFFDSTSMVGPAKKGLPDGLKVDAAGNLFATGPGGVLVFSPDGKHLGTINTGEATANVGWGDDGSVLYITADMYLCRIKTKTRGNRY
jgi:gluconolactonase